MTPGIEIAADHFGDVGNVSAGLVALLALVTALGGALAWFVRYTIGQQLAPILERLTNVEHEVSANGEVARTHSGKVDAAATTTKDLTIAQSGQLDEVLNMLGTLLQREQDKG